MTHQQRQQRAAFIHEQPILWLFVLYGATFFGCSAAWDALQLWGGWTTTLGQRYLLPLAIAFGQWLGLRLWASRILASSQGDSGA